MGMSLKILGVISAITGITYLIGVGGNWTPLAIWLVIAIPGYIASLYLHPRRNCWACDGSGKHTGFVFTYANRPCENCDGSGRRLRLGARMLNIPLR